MKRTTIPALALCLMASLCLLPGRARAAADPARAVAPCVSGQHASWTPLASEADVLASCFSSDETRLFLRAGRYYLAGDLTLGRGLTLPAGVDLCLAGHNITVTGGPTGSTPAILFCGTQAKPVRLCDCVGGGQLTHTLSGIYMAGFSGSQNDLFGGSITSCLGRYGAAIIQPGGGLNMYDGASIVDNDCTAYSLVGGLCVQGGVFRMYGGEIARNRGCTGGGIDVNQGLASTVEIYGGSIHDNVATAGAGGGIRVFCSKFSGTTRTENAPSVLNMYGGEIRGNTASGPDGGGGVALCSDGAVFNFYGGEIAGNISSAGPGGGVSVRCLLGSADWPVDAAVNMYGGAIHANTARDQGAGGGVALASAANHFHMYGGEIYGNAAGGGGPALSNGADSADCVYHAGRLAGAGFAVKGALYYPFRVNGQALACTNALAPMTYSDDTVTWSGEDQTLTVNADCTLTYGTDGRLPAGQKITVDLYGRTVTLDGGVLRCAGDLTVMDSSDVPGRLIGRVDTVFGAIAVLDPAVVTEHGKLATESIPACFDLSGGRIVNNTSGTTGGGAVIYGSGARLTMTGGEFSGNASGASSPEMGGGVYLGSSAAMELLGGAIRGNVSNNNGGGVGIGQGAVLTMSGGEIADNSIDTGTAASNSRGGGVCVSSGGAFHLTGGEIRGNRAISAGGVALNGADALFTMSGGAIRGNRAGTGGVSGNLTGSGGGFGGGGLGLVFGTARAELTGGVIADNRAYHQGGGIAAYSGSVVLGGVTLNGNGCDCPTLGSGAAVLIGSMAEGAMLPANLTVNDGTTITGHSFDRLTGTAVGNGAAIAVSRGSITVNGGSITGNDTGKADAAVSVIGGATDGGKTAVTLTGGEITGNGSDLILTGSGISFRMEGGTVGSGASGGPLLLRAPNTTDAVTGEITGGTVNALLNSEGSGSVTVDVRRGNILGVEDRAGFRLHGGNYGRSDYVLAHATTSEATLTDSGIPDFPYTLRLSAAVPGDLNGDDKVNGKDAVMLQRFLAGGYGVELTQAVADLNGDGKINGKDAVMLQRYLAGGYNIVL